jgi:glycine cleavage system transcriptional repressor|tara:strand:+ start:126 stop:674 length:549 start_codon:yes stop_codon:yes gene_type:complete
MDEENRYRYLLTVLGEDRPGIVASVTKGLSVAGCNIEQSSMSVLGSSFAIILVVNVPQESENRFRTSLVGITTVEDLKIHVDQFPSGSLYKVTEGQPYNLTLHGSDHQGIIASVTSVLSQNKINIADLASKVIQGEEPIFLMTMDLIVPPNVDVNKVATSLMELGTDIKCEINFSGEDTITC